MADGCVILVQLIELSLLEKDNCIPELLLDLPVLLLESREFSPCQRRNIDGSWIIIRISWLVAIHVQYIGQPRISIFWFALVGLFLRLFAIVLGGLHRIYRSKLKGLKIIGIIGPLPGCRGHRYLQFIIIFLLLYSDRWRYI